MKPSTALERIEHHEAVEGVAPNLFGSPDPKAAVEVVTEYANVLRDVLKQKHLTSNIKGREHVMVEGWTLLGSLLGVFPVLVSTSELSAPEGWKGKPGTVFGFQATVHAQTRAGETVGAATARCTRGEGTWSSRDDYALLSMAQTRATSKALRQPLGFIVVLAGYEATPEEELP